MLFQHYEEIFVTLIEEHWGTPRDKSLEKKSRTPYLNKSKKSRTNKEQIKKNREKNQKIMKKIKKSCL